jgi:hypothetical protein
MMKDPDAWKGKTLDCVSCNSTGVEVADALSEASKIRCHYSVAVPRFAQYLFMGDLYYMVSFFETQGYSGSIEEFKKVVPDAMGPLEFFQQKGQWSDGEKFATEGPIVEVGSSCTLL